MKLRVSILFTILTLGLILHQSAVALPIVQESEGYRTENDSPKVIMSIMPKPGTTIITLHYTSSNTSKFILNICNTNNEVLFSKNVELQKGKNTIDIVDVKALQSNTYFLCLLQNDVQIISAPFIML